MPALEPDQQQGLPAREDQPLIGIPDDGNVIRYFTDEQEADQAVSREGIQRVLNLAGAWRHPDWEQAEAELDRIRHQSQPSPPIEL